MSPLNMERIAWLLKLALTWFVSRVANHMLLQVTVLMESFVTLGAFLRQLSKSGVFAPGVGSTCVFYTPLFLMIVNT